MSNIDDIIAAIDPESMRVALQEKRGQLERILAVKAVEYSLEQQNTYVSSDGKQAGLLELKRQILMFKDAIDEVDSRLNGASEALHGKLPRSTRRRVKKEKPSV